MIVYLNGELVESTVIDPVKHKFIGLFRPSSTAHLRGAYIYCGCGSVLQTVDAVTGHWSAGHFDIPQYVDIEPTKKVCNQTTEVSRLKRIQVTHAWHSKSGPCGCNTCYLLEIISSLHTENDALKKALEMIAKMRDGESTSPMERHSIAQRALDDSEARRKE